MSAHGVFSVNETLNNGTIAYSIFTDTDSTKTVTNGIPVAGTYSSSQVITSGSIPTLSTAAYVFVVSTFAITVSTHDPTLSEATIQWGTGSSLRVASAYSNQRYWLGVAVSSTANNRVLVYDRNREWQRYSGINANALGIYNSNLYFGNTTGIFQAESGNSDNGAAISAYYRTPTYFPSESLDVDTAFNALRITTDESAGTLATAFRVNGSATEYSLGNKAMNSSVGFNNFKLPFSNSEIRLGKYIGFRFSVSGTTAWRILGANLYHVPDLEPR
jgi:hypothetical protein